MGPYSWTRSEEDTVSGLHLIWFPALQLSQEEAGLSYRLMSSTLGVDLQAGRLSRPPRPATGPLLRNSLYVI